MVKNHEPEHHVKAAFTGTLLYMIMTSQRYTDCCKTRLNASSLSKGIVRTWRGKSEQGLGKIISIDGGMFIRYDWFKTWLSVLPSIKDDSDWILSSCDDDFTSWRVDKQGHKSCASHKQLNEWISLIAPSVGAESLKLSSKSCKKTMATIMADLGYCKNTVQVQTGHKSSGSVGHYIDPFTHTSSKLRHNVIKRINDVRYSRQPKNVGVNEGKGR